jgi:hypothetical protein
VLKNVNTPTTKRMTSRVLAVGRLAVDRLRSSRWPNRQQLLKAKSRTGGHRALVYFSPFWRKAEGETREDLLSE